MKIEKVYTFEEGDMIANKSLFWDVMVRGKGNWMRTGISSPYEDKGVQIALDSGQWVYAGTINQAIKAGENV